MKYKVYKIIKDNEINIDERNTIEALISDEKAAIDAYNLAIENLTNKLSIEAIDVLKAIRDDEQRHIENLYSILSDNITNKNLED